jgi:hypothetical protein
MLLLIVGLALVLLGVVIPMYLLTIIGAVVLLVWLVLLLVNSRRA